MGGNRDPDNGSDAGSRLGDIVHPALLPGVGKPLSQTKREINAEEKQHDPHRSRRRHADVPRMEMEEGGKIHGSDQEASNEIEDPADHREHDEGVHEQLALRITPPRRERPGKLVLSSLAKTKVREGDQIAYAHQTDPKTECLVAEGTDRNRHLEDLAKRPHAPCEQRAHKKQADRPSTRRKPAKPFPRYGNETHCVADPDNFPAPDVWGTGDRARGLSATTSLRIDRTFAPEASQEKRRSASSAECIASER